MVCCHLKNNPLSGICKKMVRRLFGKPGAEKASHSHPMFGGCVKRFFYGFLGLKADAGFKHITLSPTYIEGMEFLEASIKFPKGTLKVKYRYEDGKVLSKISTTGSLAVDVI